MIPNPLGPHSRVDFSNVRMEYSWVDLGPTGGPETTMDPPSRLDDLDFQIIFQIIFRSLQDSPQGGGIENRQNSYRESGHR